MEEANDRSKYMCFMLSGDRIAFDSRRCDIIFPMRSVQTTYSSKADVSYLYEGIMKGLSRERERKYFLFFFFAGRALYINFRDVFGVIFTQIDATILIFIKACCWNTLFILIYLYIFILYLK